MQAMEESRLCISIHVDTRIDKLAGDCYFLFGIDASTEMHPVYIQVTGGTDKMIACLQTKNNLMKC